MNRGLNLHVYPSEMRNESRIFRLSNSLQRSGLFTATHLVGRSASGAPDEETVSPDCTIVRLPTGKPPNGRGSWARGRLAWYVAVFRRYRHAPVATVNAHSVWVLPLAWAIARQAGCALIYSTHELETETPSMTGVKRAAAKVVEAALIGRCSLVTCVNGSIADWYADRYSMDRPTVARNIPETAPLDSPPNLRDRFRVPVDAALAIHTGRLAEGRHITEVLAAFSNPGCTAHIVFLGDGPLGDAVRNATASCKRVHWMPPVDPSAVVPIVAQADVALCLIDTTSLSYRLSSPNKLFEALAAGTPPLCTELPEARRVLGPLFDDWLVRDPTRDLVHQLGNGLPAAAARFRSLWIGLPTWADEVSPLVAEYERVVRSARPRNDRAWA